MYGELLAGPNPGTEPGEGGPVQEEAAHGEEASEGGILGRKAPQQLTGRDPLRRDRPVKSGRADRRTRGREEPDLDGRGVRRSMYSRQNGPPLPQPANRLIRSFSRKKP